MKHGSAITFSLGFVSALAAGWLGFPRLLYVNASQPLPFSHKRHAAEATGMSCNDCHAFRADGSFAGIPKTESCANCHAEVQGQSTAEKTLVEEYVKPGKEIPWRIYARQPDNVFFPHAAHVKRAKISCERCHGPHGQSAELRPFELNRISGYSRDIWGPSLARIGLKEWQGMKMGDCLHCHTQQGRGGTSCLACHR